MLYLPLTPFKYHNSRLRFPVFVEDQVTEVSPPVLVNIFNVSELNHHLSLSTPWAQEHNWLWIKLMFCWGHVRACETHDVSDFFFLHQAKVNFPSCHPLAAAPPIYIYFLNAEIMKLFVSNKELLPASLLHAGRYEAVGGWQKDSNERILPQCIILIAMWLIFCLFPS